MCVSCGGKRKGKGRVEFTVLSLLFAYYHKADWNSGASRDKSGYRKDSEGKEGVLISRHVGCLFLGA